MTDADTRITLEQVREVVQRYAGHEASSRGVVDVALYRLALTHRSHKPLPFNGERLEFLGDAVLGAVAAEYLYRRYPGQDEGFLTRMRVQLVSGSALSRLCGRIPALIRCIHMSPALERGGGRSDPEVLEDALEAFVGAILMDAGGFDVARAWLIGLFEAEVDFAAAVLTTVAQGPVAADVSGGQGGQGGQGGKRIGALAELRRRCDVGLPEGGGVGVGVSLTTCNVTDVPSAVPGGRCGKLFVVAVMVPRRMVCADGGEAVVEAGRGSGRTLAAARTAAVRAGLTQTVAPV